MASTDAYPVRPPPPPPHHQGNGSTSGRAPNQPHQSSKDQHKHKHHSQSDHQQKHHSSSSQNKKPASQPPPSLQPLHQPLGTRLRRETPFLANIRFKNDLPEIPGDPKLLVTQLPPEKLAAFSLTTLEMEPKRDLIMPPDLGITLSLMDVERYAVPKDKPALHPADLALLGTDADALLLSNGGPLAGVSKAGLGLGGSSPAAGLRRGTALRSAAEVSWLMRTTYISGDSETTRMKQHANEFEARRKKQAESLIDESEMDEEAQRQAQIRLIEQTFAAARAPPVHRTKPGMRAVEIMEVLPDQDWWGGRHRVAHFDADPVQELDELVNIEKDQAYQVVARSFLRGFKLEADDQSAKTRHGDDANNRCLALVMPKDALQDPQGNAQHMAEGIGEDELAGEYKWTKEYTFNTVKDAAMERGGPQQQSYLLRFAGGKALYCEIKSQFELRRRTGKKFIKPQKVNIQKRPLTQQEVQEIKKRKRVLYSHSTGNEGDEQGGEGWIENGEDVE